MRRLRSPLAGALLTGGLLAGSLAACGGPPEAPSATTPAPTTTPTQTPTATPSQPSRAGTSPAADAETPSTPAAARSPERRPAPGTVPPTWLGTRPLPVDADGIGLAQPTPKELRDRRFTLPDRLPELPGHGFAARISVVPPAVLARSTWRPGCPVAAADLRWVRLTFRGFDHRRHTGELLVAASAAAGLVQVFHTLYDARFPLEEMRISSRADLAAVPTGDGDDTDAFVCRPTVGETVWSQHALGLAVDVDPFQNPYTKGPRVIPELAGAYVDRGWRRPGMIEPDDVVVRAFAAIGWTWGGTWSSLKDLQHFSADGR